MSNLERPLRSKNHDVSESIFWFHGSAKTRRPSKNVERPQRNVQTTLFFEAYLDAAKNPYRFWAWQK